MNKYMLIASMLFSVCYAQVSKPLEFKQLEGSVIEVANSPLTTYIRIDADSTVWDSMAPRYGKVINRKQHSVVVPKLVTLNSDNTINAMGNDKDYIIRHLMEMMGKIMFEHTKDASKMAKRIYELEQLNSRTL